MSDVAKVSSDQWRSVWMKNARLPEEIRLHMLRVYVESERNRIEEAHRLSGYPCTITIEVHKE